MGKLFFSKKTMKQLAKLSVLAAPLSASVAAAPIPGSTLCWISSEGGPCVEREYGLPGEFARQCWRNAADGATCTEEVAHDAAMLAAFARADDEWIRYGVARNRSTPAEILTLLASDASSQVRASVATNPNTPQTVLEQLARDPEPGVRGRMARFVESVDLLQILAKDENVEVRAELLNNRATPPSLYHLLPRPRDDRKRPYVERKNLMHLELSDLLRTENLYSKAESEARNPKTPATVLRKLAEHEDRHVRLQLASNKATPPEAMLVLARDAEFFVLKSLLENPAITPEALAAMASYLCGEGKLIHDVMWLLRGIANHRQTLPTTLAELLRTQPEDRHIMQAVAKNPNTPPTLLAELVLSRDKHVRLAVAANPSTPPEILAMIGLKLKKPIYGDTPKDACAPLPECDNFMAYRVIENPSMPIAALEELATCENWSVREHAQKWLIQRSHDKDHN